MTKLLVSGVAGGMFPTMLLRLATIYESPLEALLEYFQNSTDEPMTKTIWVYLNQEGNHIQITDDGPGMGGQMTDYDNGLIDLYYECIANNEQPGIDLRQLIGEEKTHTLEWFIKNVAHSIKADTAMQESPQPNKRLLKYINVANLKPTKRQRRSTIGKHGIGAWAFLSFADQMAITSRPNAELAAQLNLNTDNVPTFIMTLPTKTMLNKFQIGYDLLVTDDEPLRNPSGDELAHGTQIDITGINDSVWETLTVDTLVKYLSHIFGHKISQTNLKIWVGDHHGHVERVKSRPHGGQVLIDEMIKSNDGTDCHMYIYYDRKARTLVPQVVKHDIPVCDLTSIKHKNQPIFASPWNGGRIGGHIAFEHHKRGDDDLFTSSKHGLEDTPERRFWVSQVKRFESDIAKKIEEIERQASDQRLNEAADLMTNALAKALSKQGISFTSSNEEDDDEAAKREVSARNRAARQHQDLRHIIVSVVDRNNRGVKDVRVKVQGPHKPFEKDTRSTGTVQFGSPIPGHYRVSIDTKYPIISQSEVIFDIDHKKNQYGRRVKFIVDTGEEVQKIDAPVTTFAIWDDPDEVWRQSILTLGIIEFNMNQYTKLRQLMEPYGNRELAKSLMAEYTASAVMEALKETGEHPGRLRQSHLFYDVLMYMHEIETESVQAEKKQKKKTRQTDDDLQKTS